MLLDTHPLHPVLGVEIRGVDLRDHLDDATMKQIEAAWLQHGVVLFRNQNWSADDQLRFARYFGETLVPHVSVRTQGAFPDGTMVFHNDSAFRERPTTATILYALEVPSRFGETRFASTMRAYDVLGPELQRRLLEYDICFNVNCPDYELPKRDSWEDGPSYIHPLIIAHASGRPLLFCNRLMGDHIIGLRRDEGRALIELLCDVIERPGNLYEHPWRVGDVLLCDNLATVHGRNGFHPREKRSLRRTTVLGHRPIAYRDVLALRSELVALG